MVSPLIYRVDEDTLRKAAELLRTGELVAFPTETVYGLGGDAFNAEALAKIFDVKKRPRFDPLIVHIAETGTLDTLTDLSLLEKANREKAALLTGRFWPGPLTLVLPKRPEVPALVSSGLPTVALRFPSHPEAQKLIRYSTGAVAAPSANSFGHLSPTRAEHVEADLGGSIAMILDGGPCQVGVESTVLDLTGGLPCILRPGGLPREEIEALIGETAQTPRDGAPGAQASPGMLKSHYAPRTTLILHSGKEMAELPFRKNEAYLFFDRPSMERWLIETGFSAQNLQAGEGIFYLSEDGDAVEAAGRLFEILHHLDGLGKIRIHAEEAPPEGLGAAINDRLIRAAA
ncbi:MAG: threonylcarbamoyl-AMP synthase [Treponema sp.]|jgi:L-threonylcarbamoyladenylate synthase|nr:threonylcarbamoyl-AMP synthase [Treponema sp.]